MPLRIIARCNFSLAGGGRPARNLAFVLAWMDLEMTGLDPARDVIVEIATLITDDELTILAEGPDLVVHQPDDVLARMDPFVVDMHTRSGLLEAIKASTVTLEEAGAATLAFLREHVLEPRTVPLCGNSIGTDRRFLAAYLPEIEDFLHYRSVDVSSVKELVRRWYPTGAGGPAPQGRQPSGAGRHPGERGRAPLLPRAGLRAAGRAGGATSGEAPVIEVPPRRPFQRTGRRRAVSATERRKITRKNSTSTG